MTCCTAAFPISTCTAGKREWPKRSPDIERVKRSRGAAAVNIGWTDNLAICIL
jgi:hypothetical protein